MLEKKLIYAVLNTANAYVTQPFVRSCNTFSRIKRDHLQIISVEKRSRDFDLIFGVYALCDPHCFEALGEFSLSQQTEQFYDGFPRYSKQEHQVEQAACAAFESYALPFFENCKDAESAFSESVRMMQRLEEIRQKQLSSRGIDDGAPPLSERVVILPGLFYLAMRSSNVEFMNKYLSAKIEICRQAIQKSTMNLDLSDAFDRKFFERQRSRFEQSMEQFEELKKISDDPVKVKWMIDQNEKNTLNLLPKKVVKQFTAET